MMNKMADAQEVKKSYGKRPLWQWLLVYIVVGAIIYGLVYYFIFAKKGYGSNYNSAPKTQQNYSY